ncbi:MAG: hypothetical protein K0R08_1441 [Solimicrobium sp.]|jgi:hypothetical protein|nr:hypothetical protein [Solimicrobium sp.]
MSTKSTSSSAGSTGQKVASQKSKQGGTQGGTHEQHVKAGQQSHKGTSKTGSSSKS